MEREGEVVDTSNPETTDLTTLDLERADAYGHAFSDVYDAWYTSVSDADATARFVSDRCTGTVLELGVGSGRLAGPMAKRGLTVIGLDGSAPMLKQCQAVLGSTATLVMADMRSLPFHRTGFGSILIAFNTLFNLGSETEQCDLLQQLHPLLKPGASVIVEALDMSPLLDGPTHSLGVRNKTDQGLIVTATELDQATQVIRGRHLEISDVGITVRPWRLRWLTPGQLDSMAAAAGLVLTERYGSWDETPFASGADTHISVYRRTE